MKRLRVLISSYHFSPDQGSECAVGWNIATRMAAYHDVTVVCADGAPLYPNSYRNALERHFEENGTTPGLRVKYVEHPPVALNYARMNKKLMTLTNGVGWQPLFYMGLDGWHREAFRTAQNLGLNNYEVVHQLTPISFLRPGYFWKSELPFFWGPIGGMHKVPAAFARSGGLKSYLFETLRSANINRQVRSELFNSVVNKAKRIWTITAEEYLIVESAAEDKASLMIESATPTGQTGCVRHYDDTKPLKLCWSGQHEARKALPLLLHALAKLPKQRKVELCVLGQGPETRRWQLLADKLSLSNINWLGQLPYHDALQTMEHSDVFVHTSFREGTPHVVLEALSRGLPIICHDTCGMAVTVNDSCGIKVPCESPELSIKGFYEALERILHNPGLVEQLSKGALRRASELSWDAKVKEIAEAYVDCL
jgi:glycosyltransferase involved in cell wall biosynthesis